MTIIQSVVITAAFALSVFGIQTPNTVFAPAPEVVEIKRDAIDEWIDRLAEYECEGCGENFRKLDRNGKYSYSCLQFQKQTFDSYVKRFALLPHATPEEYENFIYDCEFQKGLARLIIERDYGSVRNHWFTSIVTRKLGMPPKEK